MKVNRIKSYVKGLDNAMQGGIPENSVILVAGKPGTMKSSFAFNILYHNANKEDMNGVYVTLEQSRESLLSNMDGLGMKLGGLEKDEPARGFIIEQDREIAEKSGRAPLAIKSIVRVGAKPEKMMKVR